MGRLLAGAPPARPGTYLLWFAVVEPASLTAGRLGDIYLKPGSYVYVGSALGPGGLHSRLQRHYKGSTTRHWHIDHLTAICRPLAHRLVVSPERQECEWVHKLSQAGADLPVPGFGSSDCRQGCGAHLLRLPEQWTLQTIEVFCHER